MLKELKTKNKLFHGRLRKAVCCPLAPRPLSTGQASRNGADFGLKRIKAFYRNICGLLNIKPLSFLFPVFESQTDRQESQTDRQESQTDRQESQTDRQESQTDRQESQTDRQESQTDRQESQTDRQESQTDSLSLPTSFFHLKGGFSKSFRQSGVGMERTS